MIGWLSAKKLVFFSKARRITFSVKTEQSTTFHIVFETLKMHYLHFGTICFTPPPAPDRVASSASNYLESKIATEISMVEYFESNFTGHYSNDII